LQLADLCNRQVQGQTAVGLERLIAQAEHHLDELNNRRENRLHELDMERSTSGTYAPSCANSISPSR
jgi:hypothetical protein